MEIVRRKNSVRRKQGAVPGVAGCQVAKWSDLTKKETVEINTEE
jgi:hypothetical protein